MKADTKFYKSPSIITKVGLPIILVAAITLIVVSQVKTPSTTSNICLPCQDLQTTLYNDEGTRPLFEYLRVKNGSDGKICCADDNVQVSAMLELIAKKQQSLAYDREPLSASRTFDFSPVHAHKLLMCNHGYTKRPSGQKPRFGRPGYPITLSINATYTDIRYELNQGVELLSTGIRIVRPAIYYVYHSVNFVTDDFHPCRTFASQTFMSFLIRNSTASGQCKVLLRAEHTCCPECENNKESAFTAGQFYLDTGDVLQVEVSSVDLVKFDKHTTYLGLIMMGGEGGHNVETRLEGTSGSHNHKATRGMMPSAETRKDIIGATRYSTRGG